MNNTFRARFFISQSSRDLELLTKINNYFGEGSINNNNNKDVLNYVINSYKEGLNIVIPHFEKYPIPDIAHKFEQYSLWKEIIYILNGGGHLTPSRKITLFNK
jgi:hypothetical protein